MGILPQNAAYRDDPDALSLHSTPGPAHYEPDEEADTDQLISNADGPPSYVDSTIEASLGGLSGTPARLPGSNLPTGIRPRTTREAKWSYQTPFSRNSNVSIEETNTLQEVRTDNDPEYLEKVIRAMAYHSPSPLINIVGTHKQRKQNSDGNSSQRTVTDFDILINLRNYLWPEFEQHGPNRMELRTVENGEKAHRGTVLKTRAPGYKAELEVGDARPDLKEWCHRYCASSTGNRIFRLERRVTNMDTAHLKNRLEGLIRSSNYRGHLAITFPVGDRYVDIYTSTRVQTWRLTTWVRWLFYLSFFWLFSWPYLYFTTKRYAVVRAEWPFATVDAHGNKQYTTVSEEEWISKFGMAVRQLAIDRYQGEAGDDKLTEVLARPETSRDMSNEINVPGAVNSAIDAWRGGLTVGNVLRMGSTRDAVGWGADQY